MLFGNRIKELREEQGLLQRQLAAFLEIDTPMFSKIERGDRRAKREQVIKLADYLHQEGEYVGGFYACGEVAARMGGGHEHLCHLREQHFPTVLI